MLKRIVHKNEKRIAAYMPNDNETTNKLRSIKGRKWSSTKKVWHFPDNNETIKSLKELFPDLVKKNKENDPLASNKVNLFTTKSMIIITQIKDKEDIEFMRSLEYSNWDRKNYRWIISNNRNQIEKIKEYFKERLNEIDEIETPIIKANTSIKKKELHIYEYIVGRLKLIFRYDKDLIAIVKEFPYSRWDGENGWWTVIHSEEILKALEIFCNEREWELKYFKSDFKKVKSRRGEDQVLNYRNCPKEYIESLRLRRYSENTIRTYKSMFEEFLNYHNDKKPEEINEKQILEFMRYLVFDRGVSHSYQNQSINAIKYYYEKILGQQKQFFYIERPFQEKVLPVVLSKEEVARIIKMTENLKHKCMLMLTYSAGLRVSELLNLKINDIDIERGSIRIRNSKGKKDRISLLSSKIIIYLNEYYTVYQPKELVFEGQFGGTYSASSVQKVLRRAVSSANINKNVTIHTLRHSFATHLLEQGTDLRYIQQLLGHGSVKTTEIYTHVTRKAIENIDNPLDSIDI